MSTRRFIYMYAGVCLVVPKWCTSAESIVSVSWFRCRCRDGSILPFAFHFMHHPMVRVYCLFGEIRC